MRKCPECKFILTESAASCRFCGHLLGGAHTNDARTPAYQPGIDLPSHDPQSLRSQPVVRRVGAASPPAKALGPSGSRQSDDAGLPTAQGRSGPLSRPTQPATSQTRAAHVDWDGEPQSEVVDIAQSARWPRVAVAGGGLVLALVVGAFFYLRSAASPDQVKAEVVAPVIVWERVGPPTVPFTAELPGPTKGVPLRPFEDVPTVALQAEVNQSTAFVVGAFDLPERALAFGHDAYLRATAEGVAAARIATLGDGLGTDRREGRAYVASMSTAAGGGGWVHVLLAGQRVYFAAVFTASDTAGVRPLFDRMAQSLLPT